MLHSLMRKISSWRLSRRPYTVFAVFLVLSGILLLRHLDRHSTLPLSANLNPFNYRTSPYYTDRDTRHYSTYTPPYFPPLKASPKQSQADLCEGFPVHLLGRVQVVVKTGVGEAAKTKAHLDTVTSCIPNILIFSDVETVIGSRKVIDVLADLPESYTHENPDFDTYLAQKKEYKEKGSVDKTGEGWKLDRFKFLPMVERTYRMRPHARWYVFLETDSYWFWDSLFRLLHQLDPIEPHYIGSPSPGRDGIRFAYGGAGYVMSQGLMHRFIGQYKTSLSVQYEQWIKDDCCGDAVLAYAIEDRTGTRLEALYPTFAGDELHTLRLDKERWCIPLVAIHRLSPELMTRLWKWERTRPYSEKPIVQSTTLGFTLPDIRDKPHREDWDNLADQEQHDEIPSNVNNPSILYTTHKARSNMIFARERHPVASHTPSSTNPQVAQHFVTLPQVLGR
ncbi:hypothetical protein CAC42_5620 [Sphaceloma murrayae]|uniref:N-acetylgalactosaminide beta-1,3-galactosyltransferase n=1 Tax=Sphaceloma murrayae TaxID=2082308 RepID=A0A2K1QYV5_9PEZI|nr:hypothetical protein CAC42_5620 [Sphaceloma murrayae]